MLAALARDQQLSTPPKLLALLDLVDPPSIRAVNFFNGRKRLDVECREELPGAWPAMLCERGAAQDSAQSVDEQREAEALVRRCGWPSGAGTHL